jgi:hypothetical protein
MPMWNDLIAPSDANGYLNIIGKALIKFRSLQQSGCINITINVQIWNWVALPRNSHWPWLLNESNFWIRLKMGGLTNK